MGRGSDISIDDVRIEPIYNDIVERSLGKHITPFSDITGDGLPDLVLQEYPPPGNHYMPFIVRILSIKNGSVFEYEPIEAGGEVYYFVDFNKDGVLEFVNTDSESNFVYSEDGMPISDSVWHLEKDQNKYIRTSNK